MHERRKTTRSPSFLGAVISFNKRNSTMDGLIKNFSHDGAKIVFPQTVRVPDSFGVEIKRLERTLHARVIWRSGAVVGVNFVARDTQATVTPLDLVRHLKEREAAKVVLRRRAARASLRRGLAENADILAHHI
jgi:hypothetical protein